MNMHYRWCQSNDICRIRTAERFSTVVCVAPDCWKEYGVSDVHCVVYLVYLRTATDRCFQVSCFTCDTVSDRRIREKLEYDVSNKSLLRSISSNLIAPWVVLAG
jgi:hypothetical protein